MKQSGMINESQGFKTLLNHRSAVLFKSEIEADMPIWIKLELRLRARATLFGVFSNKS